MEKKLVMLTICFYLLSTTSATAAPYFHHIGMFREMRQLLNSTVERIAGLERESGSNQHQPASAVVKRELNVQDHGARGDGIADDTAAIQRAINEAGQKNIPLIIPATDAHYKVTTTLFLTDNLHITGYGATLFMPSQPRNSIKAVLASHSSTYLSNITIEGLTIKSVNEREGTGYHAGNLTSYVQGIFIKGVENFTLKNVQMSDLFDGLKTIWSSTGEVSRNITVDNVTILRSGTPMLLHGINGMTVTNSYLDASESPIGVGQDGNRHLHCVYMSGDTSNIYFNNVDFVNSPGAGIQFYNSYRPNKKSPENIVVENSRVKNALVGTFIYAGTNNIRMSNLTITNTTRAFDMHDAHQIDISDIKVVNTETGFLLRRVTDSRFSDITIDGRKVNHLFELRDDIESITFSKISASNMSNSRFINTSTDTEVRNMLVENSTFEWSTITQAQISFRGAGSSAIIRNNRFINKGNTISFLVNNYPGTDIVVKENVYSGFTSLASPTDYSTTINNQKLN